MHDVERGDHVVSFEETGGDVADLEAELRAERDEARAWHDTERAARHEEELAFLVHELAAATGLGGRSRRTPSPAERARVSVTRAIRAAIAALTAADPAMGRHLDARVRTGRTCSFDAEDTADRVGRARR